MKRRDFITHYAILSVASFLPFSKVLGRNPWLNDDSEIWIELIEYARWSSSPHNVQPWKVKVISKSEAELYYDPSRLLPVLDPTSCFTILGIGMFIESLNMAANPLGYKIEATHDAAARLNYSTTDLQFFATLQLIESKEKDFTDRELIKKRRTSRLHYDGRVLPTENINDLSSLANNYGYNFSYTSDKEVIDFVTHLNSQTTFYHADDHAARNELGQWVRTNDEDAEQEKDGLWYRCMDLPGKLMRNFFLHYNRFDSKWKKKLLGNMMIKSMQGTSNLAWISGPFEKRNDWLNAGSMLQRLWLEMTRQNIYLHPLGAITTYPEACEQFCQKINHDKSKGTPWFLMRLGYSEEPARSFRLDVKDILI